MRVGTENLTLTHDTVGNVTAINSNSGEDKAFTYNAHNLATSIRVTNHQGSRVAEETFEYGPDNQRYLKKTVSVSNGRTTTSYTVYAHGGKIERIIASNGYTTKKIRVTGKVTVRTTPSRYPNWSRVYHYALHRDHLGSVYTTTDDNGTAGTAITHDPFGGGRRSDWSRGSTQSERVASLESLAYRYVRTGLTGHEALERTGITHMNGRLYDPGHRQVPQCRPLCAESGLLAEPQPLQLCDEQPDGTRGSERVPLLPKFWRHGVWRWRFWKHGLWLSDYIMPWTHHPWSES